VSLTSSSSCGLIMNEESRYSYKGRITILTISIKLNTVTLYMLLELVTVSH